MGTEGRLVKNTWIHRHTVVNEEASDNVRRVTAPSLGFKLLYLLHELLPRASPQYKGIAARLCPKAFVDDVIWRLPDNGAKVKQGLTEPGPYTRRAPEIEETREPSPRGFIAAYVFDTDVHGFASVQSGRYQPRN